MDRRNTLACDRCHHHKLKCIPHIEGCARCVRKYYAERVLVGSSDQSGLGLKCVSDRPKPKRGRRPVVMLNPDPEVCPSLEFGQN